MEKCNAQDNSQTSLNRKGGIAEAAFLSGFYKVVCFGKDGKEKWRDTIKNTVTTLGKNLALNTLLAGSAYSVTGPYMGLIGAVDYTDVPVAADTMASHATWKEGGGTNAPTYTGDRKTVTFDAAADGAKAADAAQAFAITGTGTAKGCFLVLGTGAVATKDNTSGVLYSAGLFTGGDKAVGDGDTLNVTYTASL